MSVDATDEGVRRDGWREVVTVLREGEKALAAGGLVPGTELVLAFDQVGDLQAVGRATDEGLGAEFDRLAVLKPFEPAGGDRVVARNAAPARAPRIAPAVSASPPRLTTSIRASSKPSVVIRR